MIKQHTIEMLADWILKHRNSEVFVGDTKESIALGIQEDVKNCCLLYAFDDNIMDFIGVLSYKLDKESKIFFIRNILITKHTSLVYFINYFRMYYSDYRITGNRDNQYVQYNSFRLCNLLMKQSIKEQE